MWTECPSSGDKEGGELARESEMERERDRQREREAERKREREGQREGDLNRIMQRVRTANSSSIELYKSTCDARTKNWVEYNVLITTKRIPSTTTKSKARQKCTYTLSDIFFISDPIYDFAACAENENEE